MGRKVSDKESRFAHEYAKDHNGTRSARAAGWKGTAQGLAVQASRTLRKPNVAALIAQLQGSQLAKVDASAERVKRELALVAFSDPSQLYGRNGKLLPIHEMPEDARRAISGFTEKGEPKLWDKPSALGMLAKHHGLLHEVLEVVESTSLGEVTADEWEQLALLRHKIRGDRDVADG